MSFICLTCCHGSIAVYPSTMGEQPLDADILDLATRRWCGAPCRRGARWALTPPFHPYHPWVAVIFCHLNPEVAPSFPLRNAMLCVARTFLSRSSGASDKPLHYFCGCKGSDFFENQNKKMTSESFLETHWSLLTLMTNYFNALVTIRVPSLNWVMTMFTPGNGVPLTMPVGLT